MDNSSKLLAFPTCFLLAGMGSSAAALTVTSTDYASVLVASMVA